MCSFNFIIFTGQQFALEACSGLARSAKKSVYACCEWNLEESFPLHKLIGSTCDVIKLSSCRNCWFRDLLNDSNGDFTFATFFKRTGAIRTASQRLKELLRVTCIRPPCPNVCSLLLDSFVILISGGGFLVSKHFMRLGAFRSVRLRLKTLLQTAQRAVGLKMFHTRETKFRYCPLSSAPSDSI